MGSGRMNKEIEEINKILDRIQIEDARRNNDIRRLRRLAESVSSRTASERERRVADGLRATIAAKYDRQPHRRTENRISG